MPRHLPFQSKECFIIANKKLAGKLLRLQANPLKPQKFSTINNLHYTVSVNKITYHYKYVRNLSLLTSPFLSGIFPTNKCAHLTIHCLCLINNWLHEPLSEN